MRTSDDKIAWAVLKEVFFEYILDPDNALSDFIYSLAQSYFLVQVLRIDPECQSLTKASIQSKQIYLDTNVIHDSLLGVDRRKKAADDALRLTAKIGIATTFSSKTKEEFLTLVHNRKRAFGTNPDVPRGRFKKTSNRLEDGFLKDFLIKKARNPNLTFDGYTDRLEEIEEILKSRYSTKLDDNEYREILENLDLPKLCSDVTTAGNSFGLFKSPEVAEHDAFHILLIQELRKREKGDALGPNYWFLTHDRSLLLAEKRFGKFDRFCSSIFVDNWVQLISPLLSPKLTRDARDTYVSLFGSRLPVLAGAIDEKVFLSFQGKWMDDEDLSAETIARVIGNRFVVEYTEKSRKEAKPVSEEDKEKIVKSVLEEVKAQNKETTRVKKDMKELQNRTQRLEERALRWENFSKKQDTILVRLGHALSGMLFLVLWYFIYEYFVGIHLIEHWTAFFSSMILAAVIGSLADFYGYRWLLDRLLRYSTPRKGP